MAGRGKRRFEAQETENVGMLELQKHTEIGVEDARTRAREN